MLKAIIKYSDLRVICKLVESVEFTDYYGEGITRIHHVEMCGKGECKCEADNCPFFE